MMSEKNEPTILVLTMLILVGLAVGVLSGFTKGWKTALNPGKTKPSSEASQISAANSSNPPGQSHIDSFAQVPNVPAGLFNYGGSTAWAPIRGEVHPLLEIVVPQFKLRYTQHSSKPPGSSNGIQMFLNNQLAFVQSSRSLTAGEYQQARQKGLATQEIPVAIDSIAVAVNPSLDIEGLTVAELQDIYKGKITNWSEVGGPYLAIAPYSRSPEYSGTIEFFIDRVLNGQDFGSNVEFVPTTTQALRSVAADPGGIYFASAAVIVEQCTIRPLPIGRTYDQLVSPYQEPFVPPSQCPRQRNQLNAAAFQNGDYPITRRLFAIVKQNGQLDEQAGLAYARLLLSEQGQDLIEKSGFVRVR